MKRRGDVDDDDDDDDDDDGRHRDMDRSRRHELVDRSVSVRHRNLWVLLREGDEEKRPRRSRIVDCRVAARWPG